MFEARPRLEAEKVMQKFRVERSRQWEWQVQRPGGSMPGSVKKPVRGRRNNQGESEGGEGRRDGVECAETGGPGEDFGFCSEEVGAKEGS